MASACNAEESTVLMTPLQGRLIALVAIVINDEESVRLDQVRRSGYVGRIRVSGSELTTGLPVAEGVDTADLWPPEGGVREPVAT
jgi:hypothetical protein